MLLFPMIPRFIIDVRELYHRDLYHRDLRRHCQGIDTGFGFFSQPTASGSVVVSAIAFADVASGERQIVEAEADDLGTIQLQMLGGNTCQV
jgi:hypothetical protein